MNTHNGLHTSSLECLFCHTVEQCSWDNLYTGTPWTKQMSAHMDTTWSFQSLRLRCRVILISVRESRKKIKVATSNDNSSIIRPNPGGETETNSDMVTFCQISGISGSKFGIEEPTSRVIMMPQCDVHVVESYIEEISASKSTVFCIYHIESYLYTWVFKRMRIYSPQKIGRFFIWKIVFLIKGRTFLKGRTFDTICFINLGQVRLYPKLDMRISESQVLQGFIWNT